MLNQKKPLILVISGHDPTGGAGLQADIETLTSLNTSCCSVITALTSQNTHNVTQIYPQTAQAFNDQLETLTDDIDAISAIKIGMVGSSAIARSIANFLSQRPTTPVILDPILAAGGGKALAAPKLIQFIRDELLPLSHLITPNMKEALTLANTSETSDVANSLLELGSRHVLLTTADHYQDDEIVNTLYSIDAPPVEYRMPRYPLQFHGTGCTLSSAITAFISHGMMLEQAINEAQQYVQQCLISAAALGKGQLIPNRFYWNTQCDLFLKKDSTP